MMDAAFGVRSALGRGAMVSGWSSQKWYYGALLPGDGQGRKEVSTSTPTRRPTMLIVGVCGHIMCHARR